MIHFAEKVLIIGHTGVHGAAIERQLIRLGHPRSHVIHAPGSNMDWGDQQTVMQFLSSTQPDQIYLPAKHFFPEVHREALSALTTRTAILNVITSAALLGIKKLLLLTGSEVYPQSRLRPYAEEDLLAGQLHKQTAFDALVQIMAMKYCQELSQQNLEPVALDFRCAVLGELYGHGELCTRHSAHWVAGILQLLDTAKTGNAPGVVVPMAADTRVDLLYVDDMAEAAVYTMEVPRKAYMEQMDPHHPHINIGGGQSVEVQQLVQSMATALGYCGQLAYATSESEHGSSLKSLDTHRLSQLGWTPMMGLAQGIEIACMDYQLHRNNRLKAA